MSNIPKHVIWCSKTRRRFVAYFKIPKFHLTLIQYNLETYKEAKAALKALKPSLALMNESALNSLEEGLEETLTLHRLGLMSILRLSFRTTNCIESLNSMVAQLTHNVKRWNNSNQRYRWLATALLDIEPRLRKIKGFRFLPMLRQALQKELKLQLDIHDAFAAD